MTRRDLFRLIVGSALSASLCAGCGGFDRVGPAAYALAQALYQVASRRDASRLAVARSQLEADLRGERVTQREAAWLEAILVDAERGDWAAARTASRKLMEAQVVR
jgi:hypothetical protein